MAWGVARIAGDDEPQVAFCLGESSGRDRQTCHIVAGKSMARVGRECLAIGSGSPLAVSFFIENCAEIIPDESRTRRTLCRMTPDTFLCGEGTSVLPS